MRIFVDSANLNDITDWATHPWVSGFTTNPTLMRGAGINDPMRWAKRAVDAALGKSISIDGPESVWDLGRNVIRKVVAPMLEDSDLTPFFNYTAVCSRSDVRVVSWQEPRPGDIISVFAGRIMDTGRDPQPVIDAAKATGAQVLWASCREPYNIVQAEQAGCDIITVPPAILQKWIDWQGKPLEVVAEETIAQFAKDAEGLRW